MWRKLEDNPYMSRPNFAALWLHLLLLATHKEVDAVFGVDRIRLKPGQLITGRNSLSKRTGIRPSTISDILETLESQQQIRQQMTSKNRLITVLNWDTYQGDRQQSRQQADNKPTHTRTKEQKKVQEEQLASPTAPLVVSPNVRTPLQEVVDHFFDLQGLDPSQRSVAYPRHVRDGQALLKASGGDPQKAKGVLDELHRWAASKKLSYTIGTAIKQWQRFSRSVPTENYEEKMARIQAEVDKYSKKTL